MSSERADAGGSHAGRTLSKSSAGGRLMSSERADAGAFKFGQVYDFINFVTGHEPGSGCAQKSFSRLIANDPEYEKNISTNCRDIEIRFRDSVI